VENDKINAFEMPIGLYRRIGHISWKEKKTNRAVVKKLKIEEELLKEMKIQQLKYFGYKDTAPC
jgi:hypothetical protein